MAPESIVQRRRRLAAAVLEETAPQRAEWLAKHHEDAGGKQRAPVADPEGEHDGD